MAVVHYNAHLFEKTPNERKNFIDIFSLFPYDLTLNGYSLIPSWRRDRPNEAQQPANVL